MFKSHILIALALVLTACGSDEGVTTQSTSIPESTGGSATSSTATTTVARETGGSSSKATGGSSTSVAGTTSTIGTGTTGGSTSSTAVGGSAPEATGGSNPGATSGSAPQASGGSSGQVTTTTSPGGSSATGGSSSTGGKSSTGGSTTQATGGSTTTTTIGGKPSTGGSSTTTTATGGSTTTTTATGGSLATGGTSTTGGSSTTATGGSNPGTGGTSATGGNHSTGGTTSVPAPVPTQVSVGEFHTCAVLSDGHVKCWGINTYGQLGNGTTTNSPTPVAVNGISNAIQISNYFNHTCALLADGTVKCWGINMYGQLGNGVAGYEGSTPMAPNQNPVQMLGVTGALQVATGAYTTCVILGDHTVKCVGYRRYGTLGDGVDGSSTNYYSKVLVQVVGIDNAVSLSSNSRYTCALLSDKTIKCWGQPNFAYPEFVAGPNGSSTPVLIPNTPDAIQLSVGENNLCYTDSNQSYCWGEWGKTSTPTTSALPTEIGGNTLFVAKTVASQHQVCTLYNRPSVTTDSVIVCKEYGGPSSVTPGILDATDVSINVDPVNIDNPTCAVLKSGTMKCWGGRTGNSSSPTSSTPVTPDGF